MALSDAKVRAAKPKDKRYKLTDEKSMFLLVAPNGSKYWQLKYRYDGKEKVYQIGTYPDIGLADARKARDEARSLIAKGVDPMAQKRAAKRSKAEAASNSFRLIALEWMEKRGKHSATGDARLLRILEKDLFPTIGDTAITEIGPPEILRALRKIESRGALETAKKARQAAGQIFRYAVATGRADRDPSADIRDALKKTETKHYAAITDPKQVGPLMAAIHAYQGTPSVMAAIRLAP
ncbi:integrase arm-type DNA-binding domain-containing protein, partial [Spongiibacter sp.]|uniref:tyrosine-type recombinase/integrase n=1 Tax=Spongiibacter sp. TaxID=2024860 RepID=UPI000C500159